MYDISRFCRDVDHGTELLEYALKCNTRLFFVSEGIVWDRNNTGNHDAIMDGLRAAERESAQIGRRVSDALQERKKLGYFIGGVPKYGFKVVQSDGGKRAVPDTYEQLVIKFINMCRTPGMTVFTLNKWMFKISPNYGPAIGGRRLQNDKDPIVLEYGEEVVEALKEPLTYSCIADLLNDYSVTKRENKWSCGMVGSICKKPYDNVLEGLANMRLH